MKKHMRLVVEIVMGLLLAGALAFGYWGYSGKISILHELSNAFEERDEAQQELDKLTEELQEAKEKFETEEPSAKQLETLKTIFANGVVLQDYEVFIKSAKGLLTSERQLGLGALRMLTKGADDPDTIQTFQQVLDRTDGASHPKSVCAAQNALAAAGQKVKLQADCFQQDGDSSKASGKAKTNSGYWSYSGDMGPEHWGHEFPTCANGKMQSPLNIKGPFENSKDVLAINYKQGPLRVFNNGHTIQVDVEPGSTLKINNDEYNLVQLHLHRPSEEQIDGKPMAMGVHFVHKGPNGQIAVLGVLLNEGKDNAAIKTLWEHVPKSTGPDVRPEQVRFNPADLVPAALTHYSYEGSLTTPPCTEGVKFYILKTPLDIGRSQVSEFPFKHNARPVQPLNGRTISTN